MMQELISIKATPALVQFNFGELKQALSEELQKYEIVVTSDTVADAKKLATELNKSAKMIDDRRKDEVKKISEPVTAFDNQMKELVTMCKDGRENILKQVKTFEDETREKAQELLDDYRQKMFDKHGVKPEFMRAEYDDLVLLTSVTKSGDNLTAKAKNELENRVIADKSIQDRTHMRLLALENASYKAGLSSPLTRDHVATFLFADDATYQSELDRILAAEMKRQEEAEAAMRRKMEREAEIERQKEEERERRAQREAQEAEAKAKAEAAAQAQAEEKAEEIEKPVPAPAPAAEKAAEPEQPTQQVPQDPKKPWIITCRFDIEVGAHIKPEQIEMNLRRVMSQAGITTLTSVEVQEA